MAITLDGTTGISSVDGSAASPSVRGADSNSGIVYAADTVAISTGGTERLEVDSSGNIDIPDNGKIRFGTGNDLEIYHNGSNSVIKDSGTGNLNINTSRFQVVNAADDETIINAVENGSIELYYNNVMTAATSSGGWDIVGWCRPGTDDYYDVGHPSYRWDDIRATNGSIVTSDKNEKNTIVDSDLGLSFVNKLKPVSYKFNGKTRTHYGLIAQDIETTLSDISKPTSGFAGFIKDVVPDELYVDKVGLPEGKKVGDLKRAAYTSYGLRYTEFISPLIKAVQELSAEVETLKTKVAALEAG